MDEKILLFIPTYNCERQISRLVKYINKSVLHHYVKDILILDNNSKDKTLDVACTHTADIIDYNYIVGLNCCNYGLGGSHKAAFEFAISNNYTHVVVLHGDDQADINDLMNAFRKGYHKKFDVCLGARFMKSSITNGYSKFRIYGNKIFNIIFGIVARQKVYDLGSGLNIYNVNALKEVPYNKYADDLRFNCYLLLGGFENGLRCMFFPISWRDYDQVSNVKIVSQSIRTLGIALGYMLQGRKYLLLEHRANPVDSYQFETLNKT